MGTYIYKMGTSAETLVKMLKNIIIYVTWQVDIYLFS